MITLFIKNYINKKMADKYEAQVINDEVSNILYDWVNSSSVEF